MGSRVGQSMEDWRHPRGQTWGGYSDKHLHPLPHMVWTEQPSGGCRNRAESGLPTPPLHHQPPILMENIALDFPSRNTWELGQLHPLELLTAVWRPQQRSWRVGVRGGTEVQRGSGAAGPRVWQSRQGTPGQVMLPGLLPQHWYYGELGQRGDGVPFSWGVSIPEPLVGRLPS